MHWLARSSLGVLDSAINQSKPRICVPRQRRSPTHRHCRAWRECAAEAAVSATSCPAGYDAWTHTHITHSPLSGTTLVSRYQKGKTNLDFTEARDSEWQWHQLGHMQVCTSLQTDNHTSTPSLSFLLAGCPSCHPTNSIKALKADEAWTHTVISTTLRCLDTDTRINLRERPESGGMRREGGGRQGSRGRSFNHQLSSRI